jgi:phosphoserine phosphatase
MAANEAVSVAGAPPVERQVQDLHVILDVARAMTATPELDDLLVMILAAARRILNAEKATLFMYDAATNELFSRFTSDTKEIRFPADRGIAGAVAQSRQTLNIPDAYADSRFNREVDRKTGYRTRCLLTIPLMGLDEKLVGVMQVLNKTEGVFAAYDEHLGEALAAQIGVALQRAQLMDHYVHKKQLEKALAIARDIQQSLLPKEVPHVPGYDIAGWNQPADETGGDCYDFIPLPNQRVAITLADATGHGIGPALIVAETRALLRAVAAKAADAGDTLGQANSWLAADLTGGRFVTTFFGILDPVAHQMEYASAGHGPLFWYQAKTGQITSTDATGLPLGLMDPFENVPVPPVPFESGDMGILLTDGFIEAQDVAGKFFGADRVKALIVENAQRSAGEVVNVLKDAVAHFMQGRPPLDDLTVVIVKRSAPSPTSR